MIWDIIWKCGGSITLTVYLWIQQRLKYSEEAAVMAGQINSPSEGKVAGFRLDEIEKR